jgi:hypothetical protein
LLIVIVSKINAIQGARGIGIGRIRLIVGLDIGSKGVLTMLVIVKQDFADAKSYKDCNTEKFHVWLGRNSTSWQNHQQEH